MICQTIEKCDYSTCYRSQGCLFSVGVTLKDADRFYTICLKDGLVGCQHLTTKNDGVVSIIERLSRAWRESSRLDA